MNRRKKTGTAWCCAAVVACLISMGAADEPLREAAIPDIGPVGPVEKLHGGFKFTEGPAADGRGNLYFSDIPANRIYKVEPDGKLSVFMEESGKANGLMFDARGMLYICQGGQGRVVRMDPATKKIDVLATECAGQGLGSPNDLVLDRAGGIYFTDPGRGEIYYRSDEGKVTKFADGIKRPNGVILSPDEKTLYVIPSGQPQMMAYEVGEPGQLAGPREFCTIEEIKGQKNTGGDGATVDQRGNLYIATRAGVQVFDAKGKRLGVIRHHGFAYPNHPANLTFGGTDGKTLFITARDGLYQAKMKTKGHTFVGK